MSTISLIPFFDVATTADLAVQLEAGAASERDLALFRAGLQAAGLADDDFYEAVDKRKHRTLVKLLRHPRRRHHLLQAQFRLANVSLFAPKEFLAQQIAQMLLPPPHSPSHTTVGLQSIAAQAGEGSWCDLEGYHHDGGRLLASGPNEVPRSTDPKKRYRHIREIGRGGYATIHQAQDTWDGREVAIKVLHKSWARNEGAVAAFRREYDILRQLDHPNIVKVFSLEDDLYRIGGPAIIMEYIDGQSLEEAIGSRGALPWFEAKGILLQFASALAYLHDNKIVYRDLKPANVLLPGDGVKIIDFGLAVYYPFRDPEGEAFGTVEYVAPEQIRGEPLTPRVDIYAFGVLMYEMLTARLPFIADTESKIADMHLRTSPTQPRQLNQGISECVEAIILKALAKDPNARFQTMTELAQAIAACP